MASEQALSLEPGFGDARLTMGFAYLRRGEYAAAAEVLSVGASALHLGVLAAVYARWGKTARCQEVLERLVSWGRYVTPMAWVCARVGMGDVDGALDALEAAIEDRSVMANFVAVHGFYEPLRGSGRYAELVGRMNLGVS